MKKSIKNHQLIASILTVILITSCGQNKNGDNQSNSNNTNSNNTETTSNPNNSNPSVNNNNSNSTNQNESKVSGTKVNNSQSSMTEGTYCYSTNNESLTAWSKLEINQNQEVTGEIYGSIHNDKSRYYSSYVKRFKGTINHNQLVVNVATEIENDLQTSEDTWNLNENEFITDSETLSSLDCNEYKNADEFFTKTFASENSSNDNTNNDNNNDNTNQNSSNVNEYNPSPNSPITVKFAKGANSKVIENSVIRGEQDIYILGASKDQKMTVNLTSLEDNAVFDILTPSGELIDSEITDTEISLPESGNYQIVVGGTRGNATYTLKVKIE